MGSASLQGGLIGGIEKRDIIIVNYDPTWPAKFEMHRGIITKTLGDAALQIEHIGSTSVPGLAAKPIVDILVVVSDSADESRYLPQLTAAGYVLRLREPHWNEHRMFRTPEEDSTKDRWQSRRLDRKERYRTGGASGRPAQIRASRWNRSSPR